MLLIRQGGALFRWSARKFSAGAPAGGNLLLIRNRRFGNATLQFTHLAPACWLDILLPAASAQQRSPSTLQTRPSFQRGLNNARHIPAPGALVPNQTWFVTDRGDTQDLGHLRRFASRASRQIGAMSSALFSSDTERLPVARTAELSEGCSELMRMPGIRCGRKEQITVIPCRDGLRTRCPTTVRTPMRPSSA
jgi:hypothetical protein